MARTDLARVTESLSMLTPRWTVRLLLVLDDRPLRYSEIKQRMPWLADGQLHPKLSHMTATGLLERTRHGARHVTYGLTGRGADLIRVLKVIATWADTHLEKHDPAPDPPQMAADPARDIEDTLVLIAPRHMTPILWTLKARGTATATALAAEAMPGYSLSAAYPRLRQLAADGLVAAGDTASYRLTAPALALAPVYATVSVWAAGRPLAEAAAHPLWGQPPAPSRRPGTWASIRTRLPIPVQTTTWRPGDLFSHQPPTPAQALGTGAGGPQR
ncbi:winged helix-turn-helix transcriptional regulator [Streptomyces sp. NPDC088789]|uniref:winged helix-turn-helix transcriptional regulator n=1 Tax=Streptomyces sp. NPDC088789 TaxID=3365899 RepID=UPI00382EECA2